MNTRRYTSQVDAIAAIQEYFANRNAARAEYPKRVIVKRTLRELRENGDMVFAYTYKGETATMTAGVSQTEVSF